MRNIFFRFISSKRGHKQGYANDCIQMNPLLQNTCPLFASKQLQNAADSGEKSIVSSIAPAKIAVNQYWSTHNRLRAQTVLNHCSSSDFFWRIPEWNWTYYDSKRTRFWWWVNLSSNLPHTEAGRRNLEDFLLSSENKII